MTAFDPRRWRRMQPILDLVLELEGEERRAWLDEACADDPGLRADVEAVLRADEEAPGVLDGTTGVVAEGLRRAIEADDHFSRADSAENGSERRPGLQQRDSRPEPDEEDGLLPGAVLAKRYRIVNLLGRGGMGRVYRADDLKLGQAVALKFLPERLQREPAALSRLLEEVKVARQVSHPNVCRVYDVTEADGRHFLSMEYVDGEDLGSLLRRIGHLPRDKSLDIARQLCAGLAAAHDAGILHRDLKPANVMLDGRGRVRITDFGLAVAAEQLEGRSAQAGTPAYMAPEQLEERVATLRSDLYALGLVLYELFTGKRAFPASSLDEARRLREESTPTSPSALVGGFDPAVERVILSCLERDPSLRPASPRVVAAVLPGGDPLAAAVVAGQTPAPEVVAALGPEGGLRPARAFATLAATFGMLAVLVLLSDHASIVGWVQWTRTPDTLEDNARGILRRLGHATSPVDRTRALALTNFAYAEYVQASDTSPARWNALRDPGQLAGTFAYRQATRHLVPLGWHGRVTPTDPAPAAGDAMVATDLRGRLVWLEVRPDEADAPVAAAALPDWSALFAEAGLDLTRFQPVAPTRNPGVPSDARAAWSGTLTDFAGYPVRVESAAYRGKPVFFELVVPWDPYWNPATRRTPARSYATPVLFGILLTFVLAATGILAVRNWMSGRGDRRGALRVAAAVFCLRFGVWFLGGHHVPSLEPEWALLVTALGKSMADAAVVWSLYLALEPYARRLHPRFLVSWTRLLRGRFRDPLVGRDVLHGVAFSTIVILFWGQLYVVIPHALKLGAPPPPVFHPLGSIPYLHFLDVPMPQPLLGGRYVLEAVAARGLGAFVGVAFGIVLLGLRLLLRRTWAALLAFVPFVSLLAWPPQHSALNPVAVACTLAGTVALVWALRFGLLGIFALCYCVLLWMSFPVTAKVDAPHFGTGLVAVLLIGGLGAFGAVTASRQHPPRRL